jgi:hypothetical protein
LRRLFIASLIVTGCCIALAGQTLSPEVQAFVKVDAPIVALVHVRVVDGTGAGAREDQTVIFASRIGTIAAGKQADLVVIKGDPSKQIEDIENVETVFKDGIGYDSARLIESVRGVVGSR